MLDMSNLETNISNIFSINIYIYINVLEAFSRILYSIFCYYIFLYYFTCKYSSCNIMFTVRIEIFRFVHWWESDTISLELKIWNLQYIDSKLWLEIKIRKAARYEITSPKFYVGCLLYICIHIYIYWKCSVEFIFYFMLLYLFLYIIYAQVFQLQQMFIVCIDI